MPNQPVDDSELRPRVMPSQFSILDPTKEPPPKAYLDAVVAAYDRISRSSRSRPIASDLDYALVRDFELSVFEESLVLPPPNFDPADYGPQLSPIRPTDRQSYADAWRQFLDEQSAAGLAADIIVEGLCRNHCPPPLKSPFKKAFAAALSPGVANPDDEYEILETIERQRRAARGYSELIDWWSNIPE